MSETLSTGELRGALGAADLVTHWIDGAPATGGGRRAPVSDPATGRTAREVELADADLVDRAVASAVAAARTWGETPLPKRVERLRALRDLIVAREDDIVELIGAEHGKVRADALGELHRGIEVLDLACSASLVVRGRYSDQVANGIDVYSLRQPLGVCVGITPFNFPAMVPLWMFPIALAAGNAFVLKPSERDPSGPRLLVELATEAGIPPGVLNLVNGDKASVDALCSHPDVASVSFVGSTPIARYVYERATAAGKRAQALGGAKNHMVVLPDADLDVVADAATSAAYGSTGQRCMAISTVVAVGGIGDALADKVRERLEAIRTGPATDRDAEMGPLVSGAARDRVHDAIVAAEREGAAVVSDGRDLQVPGHEEGFFVGPTLIDHVEPSMEVYREEIFGPVLIMLRAESLDAALELVNANPYGNGAAIFTSDGGAARRFKRAVTAGMVGVNVPIPVPVAFFSFGGWKDSLFGDRHLYGEEGFEFFTRAKVVTERWPAARSDGVGLAFPGR
ncbi:MAG TPA: CoA-acylating methylmalonate-semialdehyde dehydrogenase [Baekduia sp.]|jgi:malonate-semialdehyde dehydrogenase (acetylating)/methylmalonate-semialdehyde dehydrogenase